MKRQQERNTPPKGKRARPSYINHDDNLRDRLTPETDRRECRGGKLMGRDAKNYRPERDRDRERDFVVDMEQERMPKRHKDDRAMIGDGYGHISRAQERDRFHNFGGQEYRTLLLSNFNGPGSDSVVREVVLKDFKKFGEFSLRVAHINENRVVYLNFRYPEDARDAKHARQNKLVLFDRPVRIDVVYGNPKQRQRSASPEFGPTRDSFSNRSASPPMGGMRRGMRHGSMGHDMGPGPRGDRGMPAGEYGVNFDQRSQGSGRQGQGDRAERFPHHLKHILPEDDDKATRTLFVGNLDQQITEEDIREIFERYGTVEDIDIKRPVKAGSGNAYAFVKFINLDMAHRAKVDMSGQYIGDKFQCKIGYGKVSPSTCLWVGGLGPWIQTETLEREFDRFGAIHRIEWPTGKNYAYVLYDSIDAAQAACQEMRGFHIGGTDKRLRVDFADANHIDQVTNSPRRGPPGRDDRMGDFGEEGMFVDNRDMGDGRDRGMFNDNNWHDHKGGFGDRSNNRNRGNNRKDSWQNMDNFRNPENQGDMEFGGGRFRRDDLDHNDNFDRRGGRRGGYGNRGRGRGGGHSNQGMEAHFNDQYMANQDKNLNKQGSSGRDMSPASKRRRHMSPTGANNNGNGPIRPSQDRDVNSSGEPDTNGRTRPGHENNDRGLSRQMASVEHVDNIVDLAKCLPVVWSGALVLKNSAFAARMHIVSGAVNLVDTLMRDTTTTEMPVLRITQRLRLDQPKLEEVGRRVLTCGPNGHSVLLAKPGSSQALEDSNTNSQIQQRPLKNLVSYLKQKEAAGVITLPPNPTKGRDTNTGVLYAFPPCQFGLDFLQKCAPKLNADTSSKEDHLVVVVVRAES